MQKNRCASKKWLYYVVVLLTCDKYTLVVITYASRELHMHLENTEICPYVAESCCIKKMHH